MTASPFSYCAAHAIADRLVGSLAVGLHSRVARVEGGAGHGHPARGGGQRRGTMGGISLVRSESEVTAERNPPTASTFRRAGKRIGSGFDP